MPNPGEVYLLAPDALPSGDPKERPHVLLTECRDTDSVCTLAYASTSFTETMFGAASHLVDPARTQYRSTGFDQATYVYPSRLISASPSELTRHTGRLLDDMVPIRDALRVAVGLYAGTAVGTGSAQASLRGRLVQFESSFAADCGAQFGVVVTEPSYSKQLRNELVVPFCDGSQYNDAKGLVSIAPDAFDDPGRVPFSLGMLFVPLITTAWFPQHVRSVPGPCLLDSSMKEVDLALLIHFSL